MRRALGGFQHRVSQLTMGRQLWRHPDNIWEYPPLEEEIKEAGLEEVETYIPRRQNMVAQYIVTRPVIELCDEAVQRSGRPV